jgi:hypothetical protein
VEVTHEELSGYVIKAAACGQKPSARSVGWCSNLGHEITCPRCLKVLRRNLVNKETPTMTRKNDVQFVNNLMNYSQYGALVQAFVIQAIDTLASAVIAHPLTDDENHALITPAAWRNVAHEAKDMVQGHLNKTGKHITNEQLVNQLMTKSRYGSLAAGFVIDALYKVSESMSEMDYSNQYFGFINGATWQTLALEVLEKTRAHLHLTTQDTRAEPQAANTESCGVSSL